jgi:hypothetical protein
MKKEADTKTIIIATANPNDSKDRLSIFAV